MRLTLLLLVAIVGCPDPRPPEPPPFTKVLDAELAKPPPPADRPPDVEAGEALKRCESGEAEACASAAFALAQESAERPVLLKKACDAGHVKSCRWLGMHVARAGDGPAGYAIQSKACDAGDGLACSYVGIAYARGDHGFPRDSEKAQAFYERGCKAGSGAACFNRGLSLMPTQDESALFAPAVQEQMRRACALDHGGGCHNVALAHLIGQGAPKDERRGLELSAKGCRLGAEVSCRNVGAAFAEGNAGLEVDFGRALRAFERGCQLEDAISCRFAAMALPRVVKNVFELEPKMAGFFQRACDLGDPSSCGRRE